MPQHQHVRTAGVGHGLLQGAGIIPVGKAEQLQPAVQRSGFNVRCGRQLARAHKGKGKHAQQQDDGREKQREDL